MTNFIAIAALTTAVSLPAEAPPPRRESITASAERIAARVAAQPPAHTQRKQKDSVGNGILIGIGAAAAADWFIAPRLFCGRPGFDRECEVNVQYKLFWPSVAGGALVGWLVDALI